MHDENLPTASGALLGYRGTSGSPDRQPVIHARPGRAAGPERDLRSNPAAVRTSAELIATLRTFRVWAGQPSFRAMAQRCGHRATASTMCTILGSDELPELLEAIDAIVEACGGEEDQRRFASAWRRLALERVTATGPSAETTAVPPRPRRTQQRRRRPRQVSTSHKARRGP